MISLSKCLEENIKILKDAHGLVKTFCEILKGVYVIPWGDQWNP